MNPIKIAEEFDIAGRLASMRTTGSGNVNDTYLTVFRTHFSEERVIVQRVNGTVFARPEWIMENMSILTNYCHKQLQVESDQADRIWQLPRIVPCRNGQDFFRDENGDYWRALTLIASARSYDIAQSAEHAFEVGTVLGQFHRLLAGMNPHSLRDTLPGFHETPKYLEKYDATVGSPGARDRINGTMEIRSMLQFVEDRREFVTVLQDALDKGELKMRLIHGDPKVGNIMIDDDTGKGTAIVDLDTAKPGLIHYDFGDALRSLCNREGEETGDLSRVSFDLDYCEAFVRGYMAQAKEFLTENDKRYLYDSVRLITFELGLRFFQDYLAGDVYFKVKSPDQNLKRAQVQFKLCESIEMRQRQIREVLERAVESL